MARTKKQSTTQETTPCVSTTDIVEARKLKTKTQKVAVKKKPSKKEPKLEPVAVQTQNGEDLTAKTLRNTFVKSKLVQFCELVRQELTKKNIECYDNYTKLKPPAYVTPYQITNRFGCSSIQRQIVQVLLWDSIYQKPDQPYHGTIVVCVPWTIYNILNRILNTILSRHIDDIMALDDFKRYVQDCNGRIDLFDHFVSYNSKLAVACAWPTYYEPNNTQSSCNPQSLPYTQIDRQKYPVLAKAVEYEFAPPINKFVEFIQLYARKVYNMKCIREEFETKIMYATNFAECEKCWKDTYGRLYDEFGHICDSMLYIRKYYS